MDKAQDPQSHHEDDMDISENGDPAPPSAPHPHPPTQSIDSNLSNGHGETAMDHTISSAAAKQADTSETSEEMVCLDRGDSSSALGSLYGTTKTAPRNSSSSTSMIATAAGSSAAGSRSSASQLQRRRHVPAAMPGHPYPPQQRSSQLLQQSRIASGGSSSGSGSGSGSGSAGPGAMRSQSSLPPSSSSSSVIRHGRNHTLTDSVSAATTIATTPTPTSTAVTTTSATTATQLQMQQQQLLAQQHQQQMLLQQQQQLQQMQEIQAQQQGQHQHQQLQRQVDYNGTSSSSSSTAMAPHIPQGHGQGQLPQGSWNGLPEVAGGIPTNGTIADQKLVTRYLRQFLQGCGFVPCSTPLCASNPSFSLKDTKEIAAKAIEAATTSGMSGLCPRLVTQPTPPNGAKGEITADPNVDLDIVTFKNLIDKCKEDQDYTPLNARLQIVFSSLSRLSLSFADPTKDPKNPFSLLLSDVQQAYWLLRECPAEAQVLIASASDRIMSSVAARPDLVTPRLMKGIIIIFMYPILKENPWQTSLVSNLCQIVWRSTVPCQRVLQYYLVTPRPNSGTGVASLEDTLSWLVWLVHRYINSRVELIESYLTRAGLPCSTANLDDNVKSALKCLYFFYHINLEAKLIKYNEFYNESLNGFIDFMDDFKRFREKTFSLCSFPFVLTVTTKANILKLESSVLMREKLQLAFFRALFAGVNPPYLVLTIRRDFIIEDALVQLQNKTHEDLKKQLQIKFVNEEGIDEGGVQKEFFQLAMRELIDPKYGMFTTNEESRLCWFAQSPLDDELALDEYNMVGRLIGLAIYNGVILDIHFPLALYKKLAVVAEPQGDPRKLDAQWTLDDLWEVDPLLAKGLGQLETFEGNVQEAYERTFQVEYESFGQTFKHDLVPDGINIPLTNDNRQEYIKEYLKFYFTTSIAKQFKAFSEGFHLVTLGSAIQLFRPEEVEQLICGSPILDFKALQEITQYEGGFTASSKIIKWFWEIVHAYEDKDKKRLLFFATGSDRVPIGGLGQLSFTISKNGPDSMRLPTSHTCYNTLMLCTYSTKERLQERLLTAIGNAEGFGLM
ncbi:ubiquitin-protein ligase E3 A [Entomortierella parvispora]|uniref:HECT-type E3 ubiquitin transferase n=1 Tax=Entomortierella parvispora TaxID=205924 RepID=A0A9P3HGB7_9FUNG|nr:ubiquitin-protein ligase E3 A [Entomortierella parvispora]